MEHAPAAGPVWYLPNALAILRLCALPVHRLRLQPRRAGRQLEAVPGAERVRAWVDPVVDRAFFFIIVAMLWYFATLPWLAAVPLLIRDGLILLLALPTRVYTNEKPQITRWSKCGNFVLICALEWFVVDLRVLGWAFYALGASLYIASGLWYGYKVLLWVRRPRGASASA